MKMMFGLVCADEVVATAMRAIQVKMNVPIFITKLGWNADDAGRRGFCFCFTRADPRHPRSITSNILSHIQFPRSRRADRDGATLDEISALDLVGHIYLF
jgi:hypothetical protein